MKKLLWIIGCLVVVTTSYGAQQKFNDEEVCVCARFKALLLDTAVSDLVKYIPASDERLISYGLLMFKFHQLLCEARNGGTKNKVYQQLLYTIANKNLFKTDQDQLYAGSIFLEICDEVGTTGIETLVEDFKNKFHMKGSTNVGDEPFWAAPEILKKLNFVLAEINSLYSDESTDSEHSSDESSADSLHEAFEIVFIDDNTVIDDNDDALCDDFAISQGEWLSDDERFSQWYNGSPNNFNGYTIKRSWLSNSI